MLYRGDNEELRAAAKRLLDIAERRTELAEQRALISTLGQSHRIAAVRPLSRAWACSVQVGRAKRRWVSRLAQPPDASTEIADEALRALTQLWAVAAPRQYNQIDQQLRAGGYWTPAAVSAWWQLTPRSALDAVPESGALRTTALCALSCHPSGHMREAALRELVCTPLGASLPFVLVRANDWVRQVRTVAYARLLDLDVSDAMTLAPLLELVEQLSFQGRREPGAVEHLLNLLRTEPGLEAVRGCWNADAPSLRRAAFRFSWNAQRAPQSVVDAATRSSDPMVRRWSVQKLASSTGPDATHALRRLARDEVPMVAEASLDCLDGRVTPQDKELLAELRCASSSIVQLTARFMLEKHFGEAHHREVYLRLLSTRQDRDRTVAAIGLSATGEPADHALLLAQRLGAGPRARRRLLGAAASLDFANSRAAVFQDLGHPLCGVSNCARSLLGDRVDNTDRSTLESLLQSEHAHVRRNALLVGARLGHWVRLALILRGHRDTNSDNVMLARQLLDGWLAGYFHAIYRAPDPSQPEGAALRVELARCSAELAEDLRNEIEGALAGQSAP